MAVSGTLSWKRLPDPSKNLSVVCLTVAVATVADGVT